MSAPLVVSIPHQLGREEASPPAADRAVARRVNVPVLKVDEEHLATATG